MWLLPWIGLSLIVVLASGSRAGWRTKADFDDERDRKK